MSKLKRSDIKTWLKNNWLPISVGLVLAYVIVVKIIASRQVFLIGDEPDDLFSVANDLRNLPQFYANISSPEQARLPMVLATPILAVFKEGGLQLLRLQSIIFHAVFLVGFLQLLRLKLSDAKAFFGFVLVAASSYLFSFSFFLMTSSNSLYLALVIWSVFFYTKHFEGKPGQQTIGHLTIMGVLLGLTTGSKLFGLIVMIAIFGCDAWQSRKSVLIKPFGAVLLSPQQALNLGFTAVWLVVNVLPVSAPLKVYLLILSVAGFIVGTIVQYRNSSLKPLATSLVGRWLFITHTAFLFTIIASPIYLNIKNIGGAFDWNSAWNNPNNSINPSFWDTYSIIGVKLGLVMACSIIAALLLVWRRHQLRDMLGNNRLIVTIILLNFLAFSQVTAVLTWYPLLVVSFLYIPLCYVFPDKLTLRRSWLGGVLVVLLLLLPAHEQWRYFKLFPYGHIDGAQYGSQFVGWNKPGFISFEVLPLLADDIKNNPRKLSPGTINCAVLDLPEDSRIDASYVPGNINTYLKEAGLEQFRCGDAGPETQDYLLTTLYSNRQLVAEAPQDYEIVNNYRIANIEVATLWKRL